MNSVNHMIFFSNLLFIHQLLCANIDGGEGDDGSEYVYAEEQLRDDLVHLLDEPEEHLDLRCAHIVERLLLSDCETLLERATMEKYKGLQTFYRELSKTIQLVYEAEKFSSYFSAQQEDTVEPREGLKILIDKSSIEKAKHILKQFKCVNLTVVVRSYLQNLYDGDLGDIMQQFDFITDLYILDLTHEYVIWIYESCKTVQDFIDLDKFPKLRILKVKHMLVMDEFLEKVSNMKLQSLMFIGCTFLISKDTVQTVQQCKQIEVTFGESYENICFNRCGRFYTLISPLAHKQMIVIKVNINKCVKLRNLAVNMSDYVSVMPSDQIVGGLRYLTLDKMNCDRLLPSFRCYGTKLEYLSIDTEDVELAVNFLKEINRNELKHLVLICILDGCLLETCDASNLFNLDFAALKVLEINAGGIYNKLSSGSTSEIQMRKLETLKIWCLYLDEVFMQMITELEMLKHLEICMYDDEDVKCESLCRQLSNLKGPIEKLFVSSELAIYELVRLIEPLKTLKEFRIDGRSIRPTFDSLANQSYDK
ncbi:hypothetical protein VCUG_01623 [Vavraia culicis subsp. floridensis]|uniref:Uncharacterized protein n=1 Tax=Vavraia culicis (isolate floridensis) TaxID=948595 RepID=L2GT96_VAVCU|nr:uncharacterized protein VCUG_01623 [Vavraia culicis subsp. floridensis]ELA46849.2 hypothetical protein VCUG_01623 [Vavraia culicis subsp. floridensis]